MRSLHRMKSVAMRVLARYLAAAGTGQRYVFAKNTRLRVFDFDDTLVSSKGEVSVAKAGGEKIKMDSATFAHFKPTHGDAIDFSGFNHVSSPRKIKKNFDTLRKAVEAGDRVVILTARAPGAQSAVQKFLKHEGVANVDVVGLGSSDPYDKARWIDQAIDEHGYDDVEFYDDSVANANAVAEHGKKHHGNIKFNSVNVPHPKEADYDGATIEKHFESDNPTKVVVDYKAKPGSKGPKSTSSGNGGDWWDEQSDHFKQNYCREHERSKHCPGSRVTVAGTKPKRLSQIEQRARSTGNRKVRRYVESDLADKFEQAGPMVGIWLESLEHDFDKLVKKPEGAFKGFTSKDFDDLFQALFGYARKG